MPAYRRLAITYSTRDRFLGEWLLRPQMQLPIAAEIHTRLARHSFELIPFNDGVNSDYGL
jgi:hypothetical protein